MQKKLLSLSVLLLTAFASLAQTEKTGPPVSWQPGIQLPAEVLVMPAVDNTAEVEQEMARRASTQEKFFKFGHDEHVAINLMDEAQATVLPDGNVLRLLRIRSAGALSINLVFSEFELAQGARLYLYDKKKKQYIGSHTQKNNNEARVLGTDLIYSDEIVVELVEPAAFAGTSKLTIGNVVHGFLNLDEEAAKVLNQSGDCEYDVNCPIGAGWEKQRNATAMLVNTNGFCTGSLVTNTSGTVIPYLLTADHCGGNPTSWVFRFRWEAPAAQADCATPANSVNGPENMNINGGTKKASSAASDFHLIQLNSTPDPAWDIYYNGWDRTEFISDGAVGVHHPRGDIKKISFEYEPLISTTFGSCPPNSHWGITNWDNGVTEPASSGSPLFNTSHSKRTIGQLHGGASTCTAPVKSDEYGKFSVSWEGQGTSSTRLRDWLDPSGTGADFTDGFDPNVPVASLDAGLDHLRGVSGTVCGSSSVTPTLEIYNPGSATLTSAVITYWLDGANPATYNWSGSLLAFQNETVTLPALTVPSGSHTFFAKVSLPNGGADEKALNDTVSSGFSIIADPVYANLSLTFDCYASETAWQLTDEEGEIVYSGSNYTNSNPGTTITQQFCLAAECYTFTVTDSYGDGMDGGSNCDNGFFTITDVVSGDTLAELKEADADFGNDLDSPFCMDDDASLTHLDQMAWKIFPNPATTELTVDLSGLSGQGMIAVRNATGQLITAFTASGSTEKIDLKDLAKGVYFITLTSESSVTTKTFVVQ